MRPAEASVAARAASARDLEPALSRAVGLERTMARIRWGGVALGFIQVLTYYQPYRPGMLALALGVAGAFAVVSAAIHFSAGRVRTLSGASALSFVALAADVTVCFAFVFLYTFDVDTAMFALVYILPLEGALRYQLRGALITMSVATALYTVREAFGAVAYGHPFLPVSISFRMGIGFIIAAVAGAMAAGLVRERNQLREAVERLARRTEESDSLLAAIGDAGLGFMVIRAGRLEYVNDAFCTISGYERDELLALESIEAVVDRAESDRIAAAIRERGEGDPERHETYLRRRDGTIVDLEVAVKVLDAGDQRQFIVVALDVTERKRLEEMKDAFLTAVSHELRTPLTAILGFAFTLGRDGLTLRPEQTRHIVDRLVTRARKLDHLLRDLLDVDRLAHGVVTPNRRPVDVGSLVQAVADESDETSRRVVKVRTVPVVVSVDPAKVERIVENLLANAAKHTPPDATIWVKAGPHSDGVLIVVEDDGPGVPTEFREAVFEPFRRGAEEVRHSPGVGVGLTLVARFADLHGGRAWVDERPGGGASFKVFLPDSPNGMASTRPRPRPLFGRGAARRGQSRPRARRPI